MGENVLALIPGDIIAAASKTLSPAETCKEAYQEVTVAVPVHGFTARIRFKRFEHKHGRSRYYFWTADFAATVE